MMALKLWIKCQLCIMSLMKVHAFSFPKSVGYLYRIDLGNFHSSILTPPNVPTTKIGKRVIIKCNIQNDEENIKNDQVKEGISESRRRSLLVGFITAVSTLSYSSFPAWAAFTPGGTLVDYEVGPTIGNNEASPSRKSDNSNVLFAQDHYFKFGTAGPWIPPGSTTFPPGPLPFAPSQQRYDALKKYSGRVLSGIDAVNKASCGGTTSSASSFDDPVYALRPMGLLANSFLASENTGTTNQLLLARWYINEMGLAVDDARRAGVDDAERQRSCTAARKAANSYLTLINRSITSKVGTPFEYLPL